MSADVRSIPDTASVLEAARMMRDHDVGFLPVCDTTSGRLVGVITDRDLATRTCAEDLLPSRTPVSEVFTTGPIYCFEDTELQAAEDTMVQQRVARLVVIDTEGQPVGIVSLNSILRAGRRWAKARSRLGRQRPGRDDGQPPPV